MESLSKEYKLHLTSTRDLLLEGMSKIPNKLVQTKLSFSSGSNKSEGNNSLKRKLSYEIDSDTTIMNSANISKNYNKAKTSKMSRNDTPARNEPEASTSKENLADLEYAQVLPTQREESPELFEHEGDDGKYDYNALGTCTRQCWGKPIDELKRAPKCYSRELPPLKVSKNGNAGVHSVLFYVPEEGFTFNGRSPEPFGRNYKDTWDDRHVKMPCSQSSEIPNENGKPVSRWNEIRNCLKTKIYDVFTLKEQILKYNSHYKRHWDFETLTGYFEKYLRENNNEKKNQFFNEILPEMQKLVCDLPAIVPRAVPLLKQGESSKLTLSQKQVSCLLANAFFCTFPRRNRAKKSNIPDINFTTLFNSPSSEKKFQKLDCIINYFRRVTQNMPQGTVTFSRQCMSYFPDWKNEICNLSDIHVSPHGSIEDDGIGMLQADFANKYIGGGVLGRGCVQEEIRFLICPEMIITRLFTEVLEKNEALIMTGCERFSNYTGYAQSFQYDGNYQDKTERDAWGRLETEVVALDAMDFSRYRDNEQFQYKYVLRELNKAYCAFKQSEERGGMPAVCTGNWGCGAFRGNKYLKALIQLMAASKAGRELCYLTFDDQELCDQFVLIHKILTEDNSKIKDVLKEISEYEKRKPRAGYSLFQFITESLGEDWSFGREESPGSEEQFGVQYDSQDFKANTP